MKGRISNKMGEIQINPDVIALYAGTIAVECFGIVGMAAVSMKDGLVKLLKVFGQQPPLRGPGKQYDIFLNFLHTGNLSA